MHIPVLLNEVLQYLDPKPGENFIDCTIGMGGHAVAILEKTAPDGKVLGIDADVESLKQIKDLELKIKDSKRLILINGNFADIAEIVKKEKVEPVYGILMDLGWSSWQLETSGRGLSFLRDEPLLMQLSTTNGQHPTAEEVVNTYSEEELAKSFWEYGEERFSRRIAAAIIRERKHKKIKRTTRLVEIILKAVPVRYHRLRIHPATRTFQALRIMVNNELQNLTWGLEGAMQVLAPDGKLVVISFHSLEDHIVKNFFRNQKKLGQLDIVTKRPIGPSEEEMASNPRSRSAKLRVAVRKS